MSEEELFEVRDVAKNVELSSSSVYRYIHDLDPEITRSVKGKRFFNEEDFQNFCNKIKQKQKDQKTKRIKIKGPLREHRILAGVHVTRRKDIIDKWGVNKFDTSSVDIEIGMLTEKIDEITDKLKNINECDNFGRFHLRGELIKSIGERRKKLHYLKETDYRRYKKALERLNKRA